MTKEELRQARVVCVRQVIPGDGNNAAYHAGKGPNNYPVPAIWKCGLCGQDSNNCYLACTATYSDY